MFKIKFKTFTIICLFIIIIELGIIIYGGLDIDPDQSNIIIPKEFDDPKNVNDIISDLNSIGKEPIIFTDSTFLRTIQGARIRDYNTIVKITIKGILVGVGEIVQKPSPEIETHYIMLFVFLNNEIYYYVELIG